MSELEKADLDRIDSSFFFQLFDKLLVLAASDNNIANSHEKLLLNSMATALCSSQCLTRPELVYFIKHYPDHHLPIATIFEEAGLPTCIDLILERMQQQAHANGLWFPVPLNTTETNMSIAHLRKTIIALYEKQTTENFSETQEDQLFALQLALSALRFPKSLSKEQLEEFAIHQDKNITTLRRFTVTHPVPDFSDYVLAVMQRRAGETGAAFTLSERARPYDASRSDVESVHYQGVVEPSMSHVLPKGR